MKINLILFFIGCALGLLFHQEAIAQSQKPVIKPEFQEATRMMNAPKIPVADLPQTAKIKLIGDALRRRNLPVPDGLVPGATLKLSLTKATNGSETYLHLFKPQGVNFHTDSANFSGTQFWQDGSLWMIIKPVAPGKYFFDFAVKNTGVGTVQYTVLTGDAKTAATQVSDVINA